jgi:hypothetical protein
MAQQLFRTRGRTCYAIHEFPDGSKGCADGDFYDIPIFESIGKLTRGEDGQPQVERRFLKEDQWIENLVNMEECRPDLSAYEIRDLYFKEVCPTAFIDPVIQQLIEAERAASEYRLDIGNEEVRNAVLGFPMGLADLLDAFAIIRGTKSRYEKWYMDDQERRHKMKQDK